MKLTDAVIDLLAKADEHLIMINGITVSEAQAKQIASECPGNYRLALPPKGSKEPILAGHLVGIPLWVKPDKLTPKEEVASALNDLAKFAESGHPEWADALRRIANNVEKL